MTTTSDTPAPALKEMFDAARYQQLARELTAIEPTFDADHFLTLALADLEPLSLMQRVRRTTECLRATLPDDYAQALAILRQLAPRIDHGFVSIVLPDYVAQYGLDDFDLSLDALHYFTRFGSAEFAIREFLRHDLPRTLTVMERWSRDENEHVRRLASEGTRPRLPWSFRLDALIRDPNLVAPILDNLKADDSLYVRKSVANHLNDITKDDPQWVLDRLATWPLHNPHTAWIMKRALRTLIKAGDARALNMIGAGERAQVQIHQASITPRQISLGDTITLTCELTSTATQPQNLVVDYIVHYVKKSGGTSRKVFKLKELSLAPGATINLTRRQTIRNFTTRTHYPGRHNVEIMVNGEVLASDYFELWNS